MFTNQDKKNLARIIVGLLLLFGAMMLFFFMAGGGLMMLALMLFSFVGALAFSRITRPYIE